MSETESMRESKVVAIRLPEAVWARYSFEAEAQGLPMGTYLRQKLEHEEDIAERLTRLHETLLLLLGPGIAATSSAGADGAVAVESLLLLRQLAGPHQANLAQKEVERRGLKPWR